MVEEPWHCQGSSLFPPLKFSPAVNGNFSQPQCMEVLVQAAGLGGESERAHTTRTGACAELGEVTWLVLPRTSTRQAPALATCSARTGLTQHGPRACAEHAPRLLVLPSTHTDRMAFEGRLWRGPRRRTPGARRADAARRLRPRNHGRGEHRARRTPRSRLRASPPAAPS